MLFLRKYIPALLAILLFTYYLVLAWVLHRTGFEHSEALFLAEKTKLLFQARDNTLLTLGTTFPSLVFLSTVVFSFFGFPFAPVLASASFTTLLFFILVKDFSKTNIQQRIYLPMLVLLFVLHPGLIYTGVTGRGVALVLLFFYLVFRSLFSYYKTQTTFSLSMASIYLTCLIFCNFSFIWLLLGLIPFVVLVALDGLKQAKHGSPIIQYYESVNNSSQRRKLTNRTIAIYIILFLLPLVALYLFRVLNSVHAGNGTYFLTSQYSNWSITGTESLGSIYNRSGQSLNILAQHQIIFPAYILALTPLLLVVFFWFKGRLYELCTLLAPFILISILLLDNQIYFTVEYYLIFLILGLIGVYYFAGRKYSVKTMYPVIMLATVLNIFAGIFYFKKTSDIEEKIFFTAIKNASKPRPEKVITEEHRMAVYISSIIGDKPNLSSKILMDDAASYSIIAQMHKIDNVILPVNYDFLTAAENPKVATKYLCIAKDSNRLRGFTILNNYNLKKMTAAHAVPPTLMFETNNWAVYKLNNHLD
ncbi:MAG: hypothetical protein NTZ59_01635 [Bacteroidetes bacterium]|nr:hypothetical protein [Bacteroidota bacterium]